MLLLLSVDITFDLCCWCALAAYDVYNTLFFAMLHPKFISLTLLLLLDEEALVADEFGGFSPALYKEHT